MSSTASITITRTALSLADLVINDTSATYRLTPDGLGDPGMTWRLTSMPDSADVHGTEYIAAVLEQSSLPLKVLVMGADAAAVRTARNALTAALSQFDYSITVTVDGQAQTWDCSPASWSLADGVQYAMVAARLEVMTITVPVYPIAS